MNKFYVRIAIAVLGYMLLVAFSSTMFGAACFTLIGSLYVAINYVRIARWFVGAKPKRVVRSHARTLVVFK